MHTISLWDQNDFLKSAFVFLVRMAQSISFFEAETFHVRNGTRSLWGQNKVCLSCKNGIQSISLMPNKILSAVFVSCMNGPTISFEARNFICKIWVSYERQHNLLEAKACLQLCFVVRNGTIYLGPESSCLQQLCFF